MRGASFALAATLIAGLAAPVLADTTVSIVHVQESAAARALWDRIAKDYEAEHKGVTVNFKYTPGEAYKEKLTTQLQSDSRPDIVYSWGGGVMDAQYQAGFLKDITAEATPFEGNLSQPAVNAFKVDGKTVGVPFDTGLVGFYYNKDLFKKAGVDADAIKTWDDFLGAIKTLKAAGITPLINGGGDKWPMHFYYSYLIMRIGGENALSDAKAGKNGGFKNATFVEAGKRLRELAELEPFQAGYLSTKYEQAAGMFGDGKGAMELMFELLPALQGPNSTNGKGQPEDNIGIFPFPTAPRRERKGDGHAWGHPRIPRDQERASGGRRLPQVLQPGKIRQGGCGGRRLHPHIQGHGDGDNGSALPAHRRHSVPEHLPPELPRPGPWAFGRPRYQRCLGVGRRGQNHAGSGGGGDPRRG